MRNEERMALIQSEGQELREILKLPKDQQAPKLLEHSKKVEENTKILYGDKK